MVTDTENKRKPECEPVGFYFYINKSLNNGILYKCLKYRYTYWTDNLIVFFWPWFLLPTIFIEILVE